MFNKLPCPWISQFSTSCEEDTPHLLLGTGATVRRYLMSTGREASTGGRRWTSSCTGAGATLRKYPTYKSKGEAPARQEEGRNHVQNQTPYPPEMLRGLKYNLVHTRTQRLSQNCVWVSPEEVRVNSGLPQGQGLWVQQT